MARAICKTLWLRVRVRVQHVGSFCFRAINTFEQPQLESQTSRTNSPTVNGLCYQLCKVPTTNSNCGQAPHLDPSLANELLLNNCANFQFMFLLVMVATPTRQQAGWQAGSRYESIRLLTFVIFLFCLPFPLLLVPSQPARQAGSQVAHPPCCPVNRDRQLQTRRGNATSAAGNVWPHTRTHTHTYHTCTLMAMFI